MEARWNFTAVITKAFKDDEGRMHVKAIASDNLEDKHGDRMSTGAIVSMAKQANKNATPILPSHQDAFPIGEVFEAKAIHKKTRVQFFLDAILDEDMPQSKKLFKSIKKGKRDFQLSIGGFINLDNEKAIEFEEGKDGHIVRVINDLKLDHIAVTRKDMAANPRTGFRGALIKSLETSMLELKEDGEDKKMAKKNKVVNKKDEDDDKEIKDEDKKDENENKNKNDDKEVEKDESDNDEESNIEKLASVVKDMIAEFADVHKSDDGEVTEDQINVLKSIYNDIGEFLKEVSPEDEADDDDEDEDDKEEKVDIGEKIEALKKNMDSNTQALAKATKGAFEEMGNVVKSLAKSVKAITKNKQKSGRISDDDDNDSEVNKDKGNGVWNGILFKKNAE